MSRFFLKKCRYKLVNEIKQYERSRRNSQGTKESFLKSLPIMRYYRQMIVHEPGKTQRKCLPANNDVVTHHEHSE